MISVGDPKEFAIQCEYIGSNEGWLFGHFRFVLQNECCGNWNDAADLRGCVSWLLDFAKYPGNRNEPELLTAPPAIVFERIIKPMFGQLSGERAAEVYPNTFSRFHISYLGMSSFGNVTMVLIEDSHQQRCLWTSEGAGKIRDCWYKAGLLQSVAARFCEEIAKEVGEFGFSFQGAKPITQADLPGTYIANYPAAKEKLTLLPEGKFTQRVSMKPSSQVFATEGTWDFDSSAIKVTFLRSFLTVLDDFGQPKKQPELGTATLPVVWRFENLQIGDGPFFDYKKQKRGRA